MFPRRVHRPGIPGKFFLWYRSSTATEKEREVPSRGVWDRLIVHDGTLSNTLPSAAMASSHIIHL